MQNMMNKLQQEVLMLYTYDENPDDISPEATLNKGLDLIAKIPEIVCYAYRTKVHYFDSDSLFTLLRKNLTTWIAQCIDCMSNSINKT